MKTIIIYTSKTGTTEKCAQMIQEKIKGSTIVNLDKKVEDITSYDLVIVGSPIRMGMINKKIKKFLEKNLELLKTKKTAYFVCCGFNENKDTYFSQNYNKELLDNAIVYDSFGGEMDINKQKGFDRFITKMVMKNDKSNRAVELLQDNIENFINKLI